MRMAHKLSASFVTQKIIQYKEIWNFPCFILSYHNHKYKLSFFLLLRAFSLSHFHIIRQLFFWTIYANLSSSKFIEDIEFKKMRFWGYGAYGKFARIRPDTVSIIGWLPMNDQLMQEVDSSGNLNCMFIVPASNQCCTVPVRVTYSAGTPKSTLRWHGRMPRSQSW